MQSLNPAVEKSPRLKRYPAENARIHVLRTHGKRLAYDPNSMELFELEEWDTEPAASFDAPNFPYFVRPFPVQLCLNVCHDCNLGCRYCFVRHYSATKELKYMTPTVLQQAIDHYFNGIPQLGKRGRFGISFFGGEPTLPKSWKLVKEGALYARSLAEMRQSYLNLHITTNGTCLDKEKLDFLSQQNFSMIISIDGPEDIHNKNRPARRDTFNSWESTMQALEKMLDYPGLAKRTTLRATFGADDVQLVSRLEFPNELVRKGMAGSVSVEPLNLSETSCHNIGEKQMIFGTSDEHRELVNRQYYEAAEWFVSRRKTSYNPRFFHFEATLRRLARRMPQPSECGAAWGFYAVNPSGDILPCHREGVDPIGSLAYGISEQAREEWKDNRWYCRTKCPSCWARNYCGGGCRVVSKQHTGDIHNSDPALCMFKKVWLKECAWILSETTQSDWINAEPRHAQAQTERAGEQSCTRCDSSEKPAG